MSSIHHYIQYLIHQDYFIRISAPFITLLFGTEKQRKLKFAPIYVLEDHGIGQYSMSCTPYSITACMTYLIALHILLSQQTKFSSMQKLLLLHLIKVPGDGDEILSHPFKIIANYVPE